MSHEEHRQRQQAILEQALAILTNDARVLGVVAVGSYARGEHDAFSDLDLACYLADEERSGRAELYDQVGGIAPLLCRLWLYDVHALYLFTNGVRLDLDFCRPSEIGKDDRCLRGSTMILHDPQGALARSLVLHDQFPAASHPRWWNPGDPNYVDWFFWMFRQIVCWAKRGAQGGDRAFSKLSAAADSLAQVRTSLISMRLWTLGGQDDLAQVDPVCAQHLAATYPHFTTAEVIGCAEWLLDEYERICPAYCEKARIPYPAHKAETMRALLIEFKTLGGDTARAAP